MEFKKKSIYCPSCKRKVAVWDGKSKVDVIARCNKCKRRVIYRIDTGKTESKPIPPRKCSSGMTFV